MKKVFVTNKKTGQKYPVTPQEMAAMKGNPGFANGYVFPEYVEAPPEAVEAEALANSEFADGRQPAAPIEEGAEK